MLTKAAAKRGPKRADWVQWLYRWLLESFQGHKKLKVKFSSKLLIELALFILIAPSSPYTHESKDPRDNRVLIEKLLISWMT